MTGDQLAYEFDATYTADVWHNARGGLRTGSVYLDNLDLSLAIDGENAWGVPGVTAFIRALNSNGGGFSERYVGDAMTVSNIDAPRAWRPYEVWLEWSSGALPASLRVGLYDLNSEFDTNDTRTLFVHSSHGVGHDLGQTGRNGPSIFPVTALAARLAWAPHERWHTLIAVLDAVPGEPDDPNHPSLNLGTDDGALAVGEVQWTHGRARKVSLGYWRYTSRFADVRGEGMQHRDNAGAYAAAELALGSATTAFVRYGRANGQVNDFDRTAAAGIRHRGLGFAASYAWIGAAPARRPYEAALELTCRIQLADWLVLQPDVQYILNPGATRGQADSLVFGLRLSATWSAR